MLHKSFDERQDWDKCKWSASLRITQKFYARFKDNIWASDLAEIGSLSSFNCSLNYSFCVVDIFTKHAVVKPLTDKKR